MTADTKTPEASAPPDDFSSTDYCGTTYAAKLMGLSVATVQALVEKGEIEAWKTLGGHRRISLKSINAYLGKNGPQHASSSLDPKHRLRVLIVEDEEDAIELYRCQFESWDLPLDCTWMPSAMDALMDIATLRPDLLVTDLSMPGLDGIEMLKALKRNQQLADMQIMVVSGLAIEAIEERGGLPPHAQHVPKPVNFDWLHGYVTALVNAKVKWR